MHSGIKGSNELGEEVPCALDTQDLFVENHAQVPRMSIEDRDVMWREIVAQADSADDVQVLLEALEDRLTDMLLGDDAELRSMLGELHSVVSGLANNYSYRPMCEDH